MGPPRVGRPPDSSRPKRPDEAEKTQGREDASASGEIATPAREYVPGTDSSLPRAYSETSSLSHPPSFEPAGDGLFRAPRYAFKEGQVIIVDRRATGSDGNPSDADDVEVVAHIESINGDKVVLAFYDRAKHFETWPMSMLTDVLTGKKTRFYIGKVAHAGELADCVKESDGAVRYVKTDPVVHMRPVMPAVEATGRDPAAVHAELEEVLYAPVEDPKDPRIPVLIEYWKGFGRRAIAKSDNHELDLAKDNLRLCYDLMGKLLEETGDREGQRQLNEERYRTFLGLGDITEAARLKEEIKAVHKGDPIAQGLIEAEYMAAVHDYEGATSLLGGLVKLGSKDPRLERIPETIRALKNSERAYTGAMEAFEFLKFAEGLADARLAALQTNAAGDEDKKAANIAADGYPALFKKIEELIGSGRVTSVTEAMVVIRKQAEDERKRFLKRSSERRFTNGFRKESRWHYTNLSLIAGDRFFSYIERMASTKDPVRRQDVMLEMASWGRGIGVQAADMAGILLKTVAENSHVETVRARATSELASLKGDGWKLSDATRLALANLTLEGTLLVVTAGMAGGVVARGTKWMLEAGSAAAKARKWMFIARAMGSGYRAGRYVQGATGFAANTATFAGVETGVDSIRGIEGPDFMARWKSAAIMIGAVGVGMAGYRAGTGKLLPQLKKIRAAVDDALRGADDLAMRTFKKPVAKLSDGEKFSLAVKKIGGWRKFAYEAGGIGAEAMTFTAVQAAESIAGAAGEHPGNLDLEEMLLLNLKTVLELKAGNALGHRAAAYAGRGIARATDKRRAKAEEEKRAALKKPKALKLGEELSKKGDLDKAGEIIFSTSPSGLHARPPRGMDVVAAAEAAIRQRKRIGEKKRIIVNLQGTEGGTRISEETGQRLKELAEEHGVIICIKGMDLSGKPFAIEYEPAAEAARQREQGSLAAAGKQRHPRRPHVRRGRGPRIGVEEAQKRLVEAIDKKLAGTAGGRERPEPVGMARRSMPQQRTEGFLAPPPAPLPLLSVFSPGMPLYRAGQWIAEGARRLFGRDRAADAKPEGTRPEGLGPASEKPAAPVHEVAPPAARSVADAVLGFMDGRVEKQTTAAELVERMIALDEYLTGRRSEYRPGRAAHAELAGAMDGLLDDIKRNGSGSYVLYLSNNGLDRVTVSFENRRVRLTHHGFPPTEEIGARFRNLEAEAPPSSPVQTHARRASPRKMGKLRGLTGRGDMPARQRTKPAAPHDPGTRGPQRARARDPVTTPRRVAGGAPPVARPEVKIVKGEAGNGDAPATEIKTSHGAAAATTHEGVGYKEYNEDGAALVRGPSGEIHLLDVDGMGGHEGGREAAWRALDLISEALSRGKSVGEAYDAAIAAIRGARQGDACAVSATVIPPSRLGEPARVKFNWVGDARGILLRRLPDGRLAIFFRTVDDNWATHIVRSTEKDAYRPGQQERILRHAHASVVMQGLGMDGVRLRELKDGDIAPGEKISEFADGIPLQDGDVALLGSDGLWENFRSAGIIADLISSCKTAYEVVDVLKREVLYRMGVLEWANKIRSGTNELVPFTYEGLDALMRGEKLFVSRKGDIFQEVPDDFVPRQGQTVEEIGGRRYLLVDHYKQDNLSVTAYVHGEAAEAADERAPAAPSRPVPPPIPAREPLPPPQAIPPLRLETSAGTVEIDPSAETLYIGRDPACQIKFASDRVSRQHAMIARMRDGSHRIINLSRTNPTLIRRAGDPQERWSRFGDNGVVLHDGDAISVGDQRLVWHEASQKAEAGPAAPKPAPPASPARQPAPQTLPRVGVIFGGITNFGFGSTIPHDGSVVRVNPHLEVRFNPKDDCYEARESGKAWHSLVPGQEIEADGRVYSIGEIGGQHPITSAMKLLDQIRSQLATEGKKQRLDELARRGVKITEVDSKNIDAFHDPSFDRALMAFDGGSPVRTQGGLLGGTSTVFAFVDPATGRISGFCTDAPEGPDYIRSPRFRVVKRADGRYMWEERSGKVPSKPVNMSVAPGGSVIIPFLFERMTGRIFVDSNLRELDVSQEARQHLARLEGMTVRPGTSIYTALIRYADGNKLQWLDDE